MVELISRNARQKDLCSIVEIYNSTVPSRKVTADTEPVSVESKQSWFDAHDTVKHPLWVFENNSGEIIGWASFQSFYGRPAYDATVEVSIYLAEKQRGKGLGKKILQFCMDNAPVFGIKTLLGFIFEHNTASINLFKQFGFDIWGRLPNIALLDGEEKGLHILGKRL